MSLLEKLNNRCITNHFLKGDRGLIGPAGPPGLLPYYTIKSNESSKNNWTFDLSSLPCVIRSNDKIEDENISFSYNFIVAETAKATATIIDPSLTPSFLSLPFLTTPSCGTIQWLEAPSNYVISDASLNDIGSNIILDDKNVVYLLEHQSYASGTLLGKETNLSSGTHTQSIMYYYITEYSSDNLLAPSNECNFTTKLNSFTISSSKITKNAFTIFDIKIDVTNGGIESPIDKFLFLYLTPTFIFSRK
jgi:hypothetical protein